MTVEGIKNNADVVTYSTDGKTWTKTVPTVTDEKDGCDISIKAQREGQTQSYEILVAARVLLRSIESMDILLREPEVEWNGESHTPEVLYAKGTSEKDYRKYC